MEHEEDGSGRVLSGSVSADSLLPTRPRLLGELLDANREKTRAFDEKYASFIAHAALAERECTRLGLSITSSFQFKEEEKAEAASSSLEGGGSGVLNEVIFAFYAKFNTGGASSFEGLANASETWTMFELELFCRDFRVIPKLCSRDEVRGVWEEMSAHRKMKGLGFMSKLTIDDLRELIARLAVYIYSTLGMQRLTVAVMGKAPTPEAKIDYFCHYLQLDDIERVKEHIRSVGRDTQGKANMVEGGTKEGTNKAAHKQDSKFKKLASDAIAKSRMASSTTKRVAYSKDLGSDVMSVIRNKASAAAAAAAAAAAGAGGGGGATRAQKLLPEDIKTLLSAPSVVKFDQMPPSSSSSSSSFASPPSQNKKTPSSPSSVSRQGSPSRPPSRPGSPSKDVNDAESSSLRPDSPSSAVNSAVSAGSVSNSQQNTGKRAKSPSSPSRSERRNVNEKRDVYLPYMADLLLPYVSESKKADLRANMIESHGPFMDMGRVPAGKMCTIQVHVKNGSAEELQVKIVAREFQTESKVTTLPRPIIPGISRHISITFGVGKSFLPRSIVSFIDVVYSNRFFDEPRIVSIPVFYFVSESNLDHLGGHVHRDIPILTRAGLPTMLRDFCHEPVSLNRSFAKPKGTWMNPSPMSSASNVGSFLSHSLEFGSMSLATNEGATQFWTERMAT